MNVQLQCQLEKKVKYYEFINYVSHLACGHFIAHELQVGDSDKDPTSRSPEARDY
jgi:hypothetical protein